MVGIFLEISELFRWLLIFLNLKFLAHHWRTSLVGFLLIFNNPFSDFSQRAWWWHMCMGINSTKNLKLLIKRRGLSRRWSFLIYITKIRRRSWCTNLYSCSWRSSSHNWRVSRSWREEGYFQEYTNVSCVFIWDKNENINQRIFKKRKTVSVS